MDGDALKVIRKGYKLTQAKMAEKLEVSRQSYIAWETGKYNIPSDIVARLVAGDVAMPAQVEDATAIITWKNHPECFIEDAGRHWHSLLHPRWYNSGDCPLRHKVPDELRSPATVAELAAHVPPSMESVVGLFLQHWPNAGELERYPNNGWMHESACKGFLKRRDREDLLHMIPHDSTNDIDPVKGNPLLPANPALEQALDAAFKLNPKQED
jgi:DNA-binding XRE family transcriptional regulator